MVRPGINLVRLWAVFVAATFFHHIFLLVNIYSLKYGFQELTKQRELNSAAEFILASLVLYQRETKFLVREKGRGMVLNPENTRRYKLSISCPDTVGIVAAVSQFIANHKGWIIEAHQFADAESCLFFMRYEVVADSLPFGLEEFRAKFNDLAERFSMNWDITDSAQRKRVVVMVSKESHCLSDLLYRWRAGELDCDIPCVISNHETLRSFVEWHGIPFIHVPVDKADKKPHFQAVQEQIASVEADAIVLAKYMQIIPETLCEKYPGRIINIHHSFLPSFIGARPYHQAAERGVKQIGATCHYVTPDLDAGPIIEQDVLRVTHHNTTKDMVRLGKDVEKAVLARGLRYHIEDRVLVNGNKTVVFA